MKLRIFVSSPGDVNEERVLSSRVIKRLQEEFAGRLEIEAVFWEHEPLLATSDFQSQITKPSDTDIVVCILWSRLGTRLPSKILRPDGTPYASGTEYEFEDAALAFQQFGRPDLLVYRKTAPPVFNLNEPEQQIFERLRQKKSLEEFVSHWFHDAEEGSLIAAFHAFENSAQYDERLEDHLRKLIERRAPTLPLDDGLSRPPRLAPAWTKGSPFRGLECFEFEHSQIFFGRTRAVSELLDALRRQAAQRKTFLLVVGKSGSGKSSAVRAGLLPLLTQPGVIEGVGLWRRAIMRPSDAGGDLFAALAACLLKIDALPELAADKTSVEQLAGLLRATPEGAGLLLKGGLSQAANALARSKNLDKQPEARLALVVDQLEELFTLEGLKSDERERFIAALTALAHSGLVWVVGTLRADLYPRCLESPPLMALKEGGGQYDLLPPNRDEISQLIRKPAQASGLRFETHPVTEARLDDVIRDAAADNPESLPLLEFTLEQLYLRANNRTLTFEAYEALGGVEGALAQKAEEVFQTLDPGAQNSLAVVFQDLVTVAEGTEEGVTDTIAAKVAPLAAVDSDPDSKALVHAFIAARLLTTDLDPKGRPVVRVAHEALLRRWSRLAVWIEANKEQVRARARLGRAAAQWRLENRHPDFLLPQGKMLAEAAELSVAPGLDFEPEEREFIAASLAKDQRRKNIKRAMVACLALLALVAAVAAYVAQTQRRVAESETQRAESALTQNRNQLAEVFAQQGHQARADEDWGRGLLAYQASLAQADNPAARIGAGQALARIIPELAILGASDAVYTSLAASPDGRTLAAGATDTSVRVIDLRNGRELFKLENNADIVEDLAFSPDSALLATAALDGALRIWSMKTGQTIRTIANPSQTANAVAFSPDGKRVAVALKDTSVKIFSVDEGRELAVLRGHSDEVVALAYRPDGKLMATASRDATVRLWKAEAAPEGENAIAVLTGHRDGVLALAFSPDGARLATGSTDRTVRLWDVAAPRDPRPAGVLDGHALSVAAVAFSPDGATLASASKDRSVRIWDPASGQALVTLYGHEDAIEGLAFAPKGGALYSAAADKTVRWWQLPSAASLPSSVGWESEIVRLALSPDGKYLAAGSFSSDIPVWDTSRRRLLHRLPGNVPPSMALASNNDGSLAVGGTDGAVRLWDMATGASKGVLQAHSNLVAAVSFSPDGRVLASGGVEGPAALWDVATQKLLARLPNAEGQAERGYSALAFHPSGRWLAGRDGDNPATVWDVETRAIVRPPIPELPTGSLTFSPNGAFAAAPAGNDVALQELTGEGRRVVLKGHESKVAALIFSPDSRILASCSGYEIGELVRNDCSIRFWDLRSFKEIAVLKGHLSAVWALAFTPDGATLISAGKDQTARWWDLGSGDLAGLQRRLVLSVTAGLSYTLDHNGRRVPRDAKQQALTRADLARQSLLPWLPDGGKAAAVLFEELGK